MADESDKQDAPQLPPKLNLRKQGILKKEPTIVPDAAAKNETSRLVVKPADVTAAPAAETPAQVEAAPPATAAPAPTPAPEPEAAKAAAPAIKLKPLAPKPAAANATEPAATPTAAPDPTKADTKRKTSRIPLASATPSEPDGDSDEPIGIKPRTIKIKPSAPVPKIRSTQPLSITVPMAETDAAVASANADAEKRKTSRIPLEEALTADKESTEPAEPADPARPKTIKIRRPGSSEAATVKLKTPASVGGSGQADMGKTARLDSLDLTDADSTPTQKKTIRVKRPNAPQAAKPSLNRAAAAPSGRGLMPPEPLEESDEPGVVWALFGIAAMLVLCVVIYMLAAQAVGPNLSGTQLSSWKEGPALSWPGKILN
ncbi:MAG: hypothetical protein HN919_01360 [Verrucomicrobia bacterium]|jgi:hypothetical protein|nr:hypothetical protein [Verrucomicrobiota bacterium]MBT7064925.1 hypothetical protein [Verrucomicrobiota bacterium]MBT7699904.1 hypothetical protein [Verrucomicrobiota bacterium]